MKARKVLIIVLVIIVIILIALASIVLKGKKVYEVIIESSLNMIKMNNGEFDNLYYKTVNNDKILSEIYYYNGIKLFIQYNDDGKFIEYSSSETISDFYEYNDGTRIMCTYENLEKVNENLNEDENINFGQNESLANIITWFYLGINNNMKTAYVDGKECYLLDDEQSETYVDKEKNLIIKMVYKKNEEEQEFQDIYSFDIVTEEDVREPNKTEYKLLTEEEFDDYINSKDKDKANDYDE